MVLHLTLLSLLIERMPSLTLIGLVVAWCVTRVLLLLLILIVTTPLLLLLRLIVAVSSHGSHCLLVVDSRISILLRLLVTLIVLLSWMNRWRLLPLLSRMRWRRWEVGRGWSLPTLNGWDLWGNRGLKTLWRGFHRAPTSCPGLVHLPSATSLHGQVPLIRADVHTAIARLVALVAPAHVGNGISTTVKSWPANPAIFIGQNRRWKDGAS